MRVHICAVGRLRSGPERDLIDDLLGRNQILGFLQRQPEALELPLPLLDGRVMAVVAIPDHEVLNILRARGQSRRQQRRSQAKRTRRRSRGTSPRLGETKRHS